MNFSCLRYRDFASFLIFLQELPNCLSYLDFHLGQYDWFAEWDKLTEHQDNSLEGGESFE